MNKNVRGTHVWLLFFQCLYINDTVFNAFLYEYINKSSVFTHLSSVYLDQ